MFYIKRGNGQTGAVMEPRIIAALRRVLVEADYKTVEKKFLEESSKEEIKVFFDKFKDAAKKNKIKKLEEKNIDYWGKRGFKDFKKFVESLEEIKTSREVRKLQKMEGAKLVASNKYYDVYEITSLEACILYGSNTKWCITESNGVQWAQYKKKGANFYFAISKTLDPDDALFKVAIVYVAGGAIEVFDARDNSLYNSIPKNIPDFEMKASEPQIEIDGEMYALNNLPNKVDGNLYLHYAKITELPDNFKVGGNLNLSQSEITHLPDNLQVGGNLELVGTGITSLPDNLRVGGNLDISNTKITSLPDNLRVGGNLDISNTKITSLPDNLQVGGSIFKRDFSKIECNDALRGKLKSPFDRLRYR